MRNYKKKTSRKKRKSSMSIGLAPGAMIYVGDKDDLTTELEVHDYSNSHYNTFKTKNVEKAFGYKGNDQVTWINVNGLNHIGDITAIGKHFKLHPLILEDIVNTDQRPKIDEYEHYLFVVLKMLYYNKYNEFVIEHISIVIGDDYVITFQESEEDVFESIRKRLENDKSRIRNTDADYLGFALMDAIIDNYFAVNETIGERVEILEDELFFENPKDSISKDIQELKHDILKIRRNVFPLREVVGRIVKSDSTLIRESTFDYFKDLQDHIMHINENIDVYREMIWGLMDMYMTSISNKMNNIMKVLTIIATIFIPLTFIVGVYGMNFEYMPELQYKYSYFILLSIMATLFVSLLLYFRKKKWL